jgi:hypothetical protein
MNLVEILLKLLGSGDMLNPVVDEMLGALEGFAPAA